MAKAKVARRLRWHNFLKTRRDACAKVAPKRKVVCTKMCDWHAQWTCCCCLLFSPLLLPLPFLLRHILKRCHAKFVIGSTRSPRGREKTLKCASLPNSANDHSGFSASRSLSVSLSLSLHSLLLSLASRGSLRGNQICHNLKSCAYVSHLFVVVIVVVVLVVVAVVTLHNHGNNHCCSCCCIPAHARQSAKWTNPDTLN